MTVVGVFAIQPVDAKKVEQDPVMTPIEMPMNDENFNRLMVYLNLLIKKHDVCLII